MKVCIGHRPPIYDLWKGFEFVSEDDLQVLPCWYYRDQHPDLLGLHTSLSEYAALFALRRRMSGAGVPKSITLVQYRKFVSNVSLGSLSKNVGYAHVLRPCDVTEQTAVVLEPETSPLLLTKPIYLRRGVAGQYHECHVLRDLLFYLGLAVDNAVISNEDAANCLMISELIPAPALGVYPGDLFYQIFDVLERAATGFLKVAHRAREGYQRRAVGFCTERLHSYLALKAIGHLMLDRQACFGYQIVISDDDRVNPTI